MEEAEILAEAQTNSAMSVFVAGEGTNLNISNSKKVLLGPSPVFLRGRSVSVSIGCGHALSALHDGSVMAWGSGSFGKLGFGESNGVYQDVLVPTPVPTLPQEHHIIQVACGSHHSVVLTKSGAVYSWGFDCHGQCGTVATTTNTSRSYACRVEALRNKVVTQIAAGWSHTAVITEDGELWAWGRNKVGQLGVVTSEDDGPPSRVVFGDFGQAKVRKVACGGGHTAIITQDNTVYTCGVDGLAKTASSLYFRPMLLNDLIGISIVDVACGMDHTAVLSNQGLVFTWGENRYGQLGTGDTEKRSRPTLVSALLQWDVRSVNCGAWHTVIVTEANQVLEFGEGTLLPTIKIHKALLCAGGVAATATIESASNSFREDELLREPGIHLTWMLYSSTGQEMADTSIFVGNTENSCFVERAHWLIIYAQCPKLSAFLEEESMLHPDCVLTLLLPDLTVSAAKLLLHIIYCDEAISSLDKVIYDSIDKNPLSLSQPLNDEDIKQLVTFSYKIEFYALINALEGIGLIPSEALTEGTRDFPLQTVQNRSDESSFSKEIEPTSCTICLSPIVMNQIVSAIPTQNNSVGQCPQKLSCGHIFHKSCIDRWLYGKIVGTCPLCKTPCALSSIVSPIPGSLGSMLHRYMINFLRNPYIEDTLGMDSCLIANTRLQPDLCLTLNQLSVDPENEQSIQHYWVHSTILVGRCIQIADFLKKLKVKNMDACTNQELCESREEKTEGDIQKESKSIDPNNFPVISPQIKQTIVNFACSQSIQHCVVDGRIEMPAFDLLRIKSETGLAYLLTHIYAGSIEDFTSNRVDVFELLGAACHCGLHQLKRACETFIIRTLLTPTSSIDLLYLADYLEADHLKAACIHHLIEMIPSSHNTSVAIGELHRVPAHSIISHLSEQLSELETSSEIVQEQIEASQNIDDPTRALQRQRRPRTQSRFRKAISIIRNRIRSRTRPQEQNHNFPQRPMDPEDDLVSRCGPLRFRR